MTLNKSAIRMKRLGKMESKRIAVVDYGNIISYINIAGSRKGKETIPAVSLRIVPTYEAKYRAFDTIRLYAFDHKAFVSMNETITKAHLNSHYEPRISIDDLLETLRANENLLGIIDEDNLFLEELKSFDTVYVSVNHDSNLNLRCYCEMKPIYFHESFSMNVSDFDILRAMSEGGKGQTTRVNERLRYDCDDHYRMATVVPEALKNYQEFLERPFDPKTVIYGDKLPVFGASKDEDEALFDSIVRGGFIRRYGSNPTQEQLDRLEYEVGVIKQMGFPAYFLIVWDFINWAKSVDIPIGPGRGSAAGSLVAYCLEITQLCPLEHGLYFERFLNPKRISMPDIDVDISQARRGEVIEYLAWRYGIERVGQIITIGERKSKIAFKDACRLHGISPYEADSVTKNWLPSKFGNPPSLDEVYTVNAIREWVEDDHENVWESAKYIEGFARQFGMHAAGVIVAPTKMTDYAPLFRDKNGVLLCQFDKGDSEKYGLLKMDLLGLKNLDILQSCTKAIGMSFNELYALPLNDSKVFEQFALGNTHGVFQFESPGMQKLLRRIAPTTFGEITDATALFRPGPLQGGLTEQYIRSKHHPEDAVPLIPEFRDLLGDTYMTFVYQEQIMLISREIAGFDMADADGLRKAIGKKDKKAMADMREKFVNGAVERGQNKAVMEKLWADIEGFGDYCFNKSHSAAYSLISYYCMWFKVHHPKQFAIALMSVDMGDSAKMSGHFFHFNDSVNFEYPRMNRCQRNYSINDDGLMIGLGAVKELGDCEQYLGKFEDLGDFLSKTDLDRTRLIQLIHAGFFDEVYPDRGVLLGNVDRMLAFGKQKKTDDRMFMFTFAESLGFELDESKKKPHHPSTSEVLAFGINIKEGFIARNRDIIDAMPADSHIVGTVTSIKQMVTKAKGEDMARIELYTPIGIIQMMIFPKDWRSIRQILVQDETYVFKYKINPPRGDFEESYQALAARATTNFKPKTIVFNDLIGYDEEVARALPATTRGDIEVIYEGDDLMAFRSKVIGYLDVLNHEVLKSLPGRVEFTVYAF